MVFADGKQRGVVGEKCCKGVGMDRESGEKWVASAVGGGV